MRGTEYLAASSSASRFTFFLRASEMCCLLASHRSVACCSGVMSDINNCHFSHMVESGKEKRVKQLALGRKSSI